MRMINRTIASALTVSKNGKVLIGMKDSTSVKLFEHLGYLQS